MKAVFFDIDDTLYDRSQPFRQAYAAFFGKVRPQEAGEAYRACTRRGDEVFLPSQRGEITMEQMYIYRFRRGFEDVGRSIGKQQALEFQRLYAEAQRNITLEPDTEAFLNLCAGHYRMGILSNGPGPHQRSKIEALRLMRWMDPVLIFISGEVGICKPDKGIFRAAEKMCPAGETIAMVGDSMENDILPAGALGWQTVHVQKGKTDWQSVWARLTEAPV